MRKYVKDGTVEAFELWDPGKLGYLAAYAAAALASGQITGKRGRDVHGRRARRVHRSATDGEVAARPADRSSTSDNIDEFDF